MTARNQSRDQLERGFNSLNVLSWPEGSKECAHFKEITTNKKTLDPCKYYMPNLLVRYACLFLLGQKEYRMNGDIEHKKPLCVEIEGET